jgi:hypothetical protein
MTHSRCSTTRLTHHLRQLASCQRDVAAQRTRERLQHRIRASNIADDCCAIEPCHSMHSLLRVQHLVRFRRRVAHAQLAREMRRQMRIPGVDRLRDDGQRLRTIAQSRVTAAATHLRC